jgi:hypothetical protein
VSPERTQAAGSVRGYGMGKLGAVLGNTSKWNAYPVKFKEKLIGLTYHHSFRIEISNDKLGNFHPVAKLT